MTVFGIIHVGDLGTDFQYLVQTTDPLGQTNTPTNLAGTTSLTITLTDPNLVETPYTATINNPPGTDGIAHFITNGTNSIWTVGGTWKARCTVLFTVGVESTSNDVEFEVLP